MAHPTEAELRQLGNEILDLLVRKTIEENESRVLARENQIRRDYGAPLEELPPDQRPPMQSGDEMAAEIEDYIRDVYSFIPDTFAKFAQPRPEDFDGTLGTLAEALMILQPSLEALNEQGRIWSAAGAATTIAGEYPTTIAERVSAVITQVGDWEGTAANAFHQNYLNKFPQSLRDQHEVVFALAAALEAEQNIFRTVGTDILNIGEQTKKALENVTVDKNPTAAIVTFTVVAAVATVLSGGAATPAVGAAWAVVAASGSVAATVIGATAEKPVETPIEGSTTQQVMVSMVDRIGELYGYIDEEERKIVTGLETVSGYVDTLRARLEIPPPESYMDLGGANPEQIGTEFTHT